MKPLSECICSWELQNGASNIANLPHFVTGFGGENWTLSRLRELRQKGTMRLPGEMQNAYVRLAVREGREHPQTRVKVG